ncbi:hypothetical protein [Phenylobacterium sp.]|uniref:hypothetical protein n=1 Tax=Phenylobacterium sp. TaxID=1871053 RepID=UPI003BACFD3E
MVKHMGVLALALGFAAFGALPTAAQPQLSPPPLFASDFYRVRVQEHGYGRTERVILFRRLQRDVENGSHWLIERRERLSELGAAPATSYAWIDSRDCDEVGVALGRLDTLPSLSVRGPASLATPFSIPPSHQPVVTFEAAPASQGGSPVRLSIEDSTGPVARWWFESQEAVKPCWREGGAVLDGKVVSPGLPEIEAWRD